MDVAWFKAQQRKVGVTSQDIGRELGRDRTIVARIYSGKQKMTFDQAKVFASLLDVPINLVLEKASLTELEDDSIRALPNDEIVPFRGTASELSEYLPSLPPDALDHGNAAVWQIRTSSMSLAGYLPGDWILVDTAAPSRVRSGDIVVAHVFNASTGLAKTVIRRYQKPALISHSTNESDWDIHIVDDQVVRILGVVVASWRINDHSNEVD